MNKKNNPVATRSSAAEYLTFVAATGSSEQSFEMRYEDENIWLTQKMMATLYDVDVRTINDHIQKIYSDAELDEEATIRNFRIVQTEGTRQVSRDVKHYNLPIIIAAGFKKHMGLTTWEFAPDGKIQKFDVSVAKNYLAETELEALERIVTIYLDYAELQATRNIPMTMEDWKKRLDAFLQFTEYEILHDSGKVTAEIAKSFAESEFEKYRIVQDRLFKSDFDKLIEAVNEKQNEGKPK